MAWQVDGDASKEICLQLSFIGELRLLLGTVSSIFLQALAKGFC